MSCCRPWSRRGVKCLILFGFFLPQFAAYCSFVGKPSLGRGCRCNKYLIKDKYRCYLSLFHYQSSSNSASHVRLTVSKNPSDSSTQISDTAIDSKKSNRQKVKQPVANGHTGVTARYIAAKALIPRNGHFGASSFASIAFAVDRLESSAQYNALAPRDRSFARLLVTTTERRLGQIDAVLQYCQKIKSKPYRPNALDTFIEAVLRIGAVQILFLNTQPYAAVKETVETLRLSNDISVPPSKISYVNAILRRLTNEGPELLTNTTDITMNAASWLVQEWRESWGDIATNRILAAAMEESPRCLTVNINQEYVNTNNDGAIKAMTTEGQIAHVASLFEEAEILPQGSIRVVNPPPGLISTWPMYKEGLWWCQDPSATIPAIALYQALSEQGTKSVHTRHVIDLCAAPGGKTAQLSNYNFAGITAVEVSAKRCERLIDNMKRLRHNWHVVVTDGCNYLPEELVDAVLVDVPCSATGTGSKRPDVLRRDSDLTELLRIQQRLVRHVADHMIQVGGVIVYATCSLLKQESEDQVTKLLARTDSSVKLETLPFHIGEIPGFDEAIDSNGWIRVLPGALEGSLGQCDGFFVARLHRIR